MPDPPQDPWPLRHLVLRTPRLMLRPDLADQLIRPEWTLQVDGLDGCRTMLGAA